MAARIYKHDKQQGTTIAWHHLTDLRERITLDDNWLNDWDVIPTVLQKNGQDTKWRVLECADVPDLEIGAAYNSETFRPITNKEFLGLVAASIAGTQHKIVSVGSVRNRGRVFLSLELAGRETFKAAGHDFKAFLNFGNGHDKSSVLWVNTSNTDTVCDNTFSMNLFAVENARKTNWSNSDEVGLAIRQRHTPKAVLRFPALAGLIDKAVGVQAEFAAAFESLSQIPCTVDVARQVFAGHIGREISADAATEGLSKQGVLKVNRLTELFQSGKGNRGETLADAFSAVTDYYTHESVSGENNAARQARQFASSEYETGASLKRGFFQEIQTPDTRSALWNHGAALLAGTK